MNLEFLTNFLEPVILGICLVVGYIFKHWVKDVDNKWIPTMCAGLGMVLSIWMNWVVTPEVILTGLASGLASTGLHEAYKQLVKVKDEGGAE